MDTSKTLDLTEHILKLTNRYLLQKVRLCSYLKDHEVDFLRTLLCINPRLAQSVLYFTEHSLTPSSNSDNFLQNFYKYFTFDDRCYKVLGKRHDHVVSVSVKGKWLKDVMINPECTQLFNRYGDQPHSYWRFVARTMLGYDYSNYEGKQRVFFTPVVLGDSDKKAVCLGTKIDKERLQAQFNTLNLWNRKFKDNFEMSTAWKYPNHVMYDALFKAAYYKLKDCSDSKSIMTRIVTPIDYSEIDSFNEQQSLHIIQPSIINNVKLKFYQSSNVGWMHQIEKTLRDYTVSYSSTVELSKGFYVDLTQKTFHQTSNGSKNMIPKGGGLFDEVGLGKTLCIISLVALNPREMDKIPQSIVDKIEAAKKLSTASTASTQPVCTAIQSSGANKGKPCGATINPPTKKTKTKYTFDQLKLYKCCLRHALSVIGKDPEKPNKLTTDPPKKVETAAETPIDPTQSIAAAPAAAPVEIDLEVETIAYQIPMTEGRYNSRATLVVCPNQIPYQWKTQIEQYTNPKMKIVLLTSLVESRQYSYLDVINADFVITTFNALERTLCDLDPPKNMCDHPPKTLPPLSTRIPKLCHFQYHRIVIDEAHEITDKKYKKMMPKLFSLRSTYKWCVTGTPFKDGELNYDMMITWLYDGNYSEIPMERAFTMIQPNYSIFEKLFRRNTKASIQNVMPISESAELKVGNDMLSEQKLWQTTSDEIIWLGLSDIERSMYNARMMVLGNYSVPEQDEYLRQICCSPTLNTENTNIITDLNYSVRNGRADASQIKESLIVKTNNLIDDMFQNEIPERVVKVWNNLIAFKEDVDDKKTRMVYYTSIHHLKRTFFRLFQLKKSIREFSQTTATNGFYNYNHQKPNKVLDLFKCIGCGVNVTVTEYYNTTTKVYEIDTAKTDSRYGVSECGHLFCGKCAFDSFAYKLQLDEVKLKPDKKKRKTEPEEKMGSCVYGFGLCKECGVVEQIPEDPVDQASTLLTFPKRDHLCTPKKVAIIGLPNALLIQANATSEDDDEAKEVKEPEAQPFVRTEDLHIIPDYVKGIFRSEYECNINLYGTKVTNLVAYLKTYITPPHNQRIIIFSQYDSFLASVKTTLTQFGLACVSCKGNVFSKKQAISNFKEDAKYRIILLSSRFSASGLDLIEANKIIFIDPVYGHHEEVRAIETQAIGRAHRLGQKHSVSVVRFLMKNTIEENAFKKYISKTNKI